LNIAASRVTSPAFHRFNVGNRSAAVVSDGPLLLTPPDEVFTTLAPNLIEDALRDAFLPAGDRRARSHARTHDVSHLFGGRRALRPL
jgi:hypothetical protein